MLSPCRHCPATQVSPGLQHPQPHWTTSGLQMMARHWPSLQIWPQPQAGVQVFPGQRPALHVPPPAQPQVPPHLSLPPQVPSLGQYGSQQAL
jgi:hypothetical protein